jgi:pilus assembly protein Flp/PilA
MIAYLAALLSERVRSDRGATAVEYGLMVALIAVVIIGAVVLLGGNLTDMFEGVAGDVEAG